MKINSFYLSLILLFLFPFVTSGKTVRLSIHASQSDITRQLLNSSQSTAHTDTILINLPRGNFALTQSVTFRANVIIQGAGKKKTRITVYDFPGFTSDSFIKVDGHKNATVGFELKGLSISLQEHEDILWNERSPKFLLRINHANKLVIDDISTYCDNAFCTNLDMRVCDNISITNSDFINYNNCKMGGNIWFRGQVRNVLLKNNTIVKYGNDEAVAFFEDGDDAHSKFSGATCVKQHINVTNNRFIYGYDGEDKEPMDNNVFFSFFTHNKDTQTIVDIHDIVIANNTFTIKDPVNSVLCLLFRANTQQSGVIINGNTFTNESSSGGDGTRRMDIELRDATGQRNPIEVANNETNTYCAIVDNNGYNSYTHLAIDGAHVNYHDNRVTSHVTTSYLAKNSRTGAVLVWTLANGGVVEMNNNVVKGLFLLSQVSFGNGVDSYTLQAHNNYFEGDTRIVCNKVKQTELTFTHNTFKTARTEFLLQEFGSQGQLIFNNNIVYCANGGVLMAHYNKVSTDEMRFNKLEITGNIFNGCNASTLTSNISNVKQRKIKSNSFQR